MNFCESMIGSAIFSMEGFDYLAQLSALLTSKIFQEKTDIGKEQPALLIPGFAAGDPTLAPLGHWLTQIGFDVHYSGILLNGRCPERTFEDLDAVFLAIVRKTLLKPILIGHSLGGIFATMLALRESEHVYKVIRLGTPAKGDWGAVQESAQPLLEWARSFFEFCFRSPKGCGLQCQCKFLRSASSPHCLTVPHFSIRAKDDRIIKPESCILPPGEGENYEMSCAHSGLLVSPRVYETLYEILR